MSCPQDCRSYYLFFNYLFFNYLYMLAECSKDRVGMLAECSKNGVYNVGGMFVENSTESHNPVEIGDLRLLTIQGQGGYSRVQPDAESPLTASR